MNLAAKLVVSRCVINHTATYIKLGISIGGKIAERLQVILHNWIIGRTLQRTVNIDRKLLVSLVDDINHLVVCASSKRMISIGELVATCRRREICWIAAIQTEAYIGRVLFCCPSNCLCGVGSTHEGITGIGTHRGRHSHINGDGDILLGEHL